MKLKKNVERFLEFILIVLGLPMVMIEDFELIALPILVVWFLVVFIIMKILIKYGKDFK